MMQNRKKFISELETLNNKVIDMGKEVITSFENVLNACKTMNTNLAKEIILHDKFINDIEVSINVDAYLLIAKQCPVATDLRRVITALKIATDLERIGDYAVNISKYIINTKNDNSIYMKSIMKLLEHFLTMMRGIMEAVGKDNIELALQINEMDETLDNEYKNEVKNLIKIGKSKSEEEAEEAMRALLVFKQIERAGDHVTNIAENIVYLVNGKRVELN
ncbi:MAG: phosphate signaling complex protein PhoU [Firmicutes bacterium]|nr:phosphate signaling complex protein PhoU [Bacillota bacterium]